jgi:uncharacterized protein
MSRFGLLSLSVAGLLQTGSVLAAACEPGMSDLRDADSVLRFRIEIADTAPERAQGLMNRDTMAQMAGMLFVYPEAQPVSFWMRNTLIPLDLLFFDETGTLERIHANAKPLDETPIPGGDAVRYVLEINGGLADAFGIEPGAELRTPAIEQALAAWPCE